MAERLTIDWTNLTPLYLGGAEQDAELRPPGIKGLLRFWYRTIDPQYSTREAALFGGAGEAAGQARFLLRLKGPSDASAAGTEWPLDEVKRFTQGAGRQARNGIIYLGFPFASKLHFDRRWLKPGSNFRLQFDFPRTSPLEEHARRSLIASIWLLGHFGGLGSRSRRGFGTIHPLSWKIEDADRRELPLWPEMNALPLLASGAGNREAWVAGAQGAVEMMHRWFGEFKGQKKHPHLGPAFRMECVDQATPAEDVPSPARRGAPGAQGRTAGPRLPGGWMAALDRLGRLLQDFRVRAEPDYTRVKEHIRSGVERGGGKRLTEAPERATFGLPLAFQYSEFPRERETFVPYEKDASARGDPLERHPSLLLARLVRVDRTFYPLFVRLDGALPGKDPQPALRLGQPLSPPSGDSKTLDAFMRSLSDRGRR